MLQFSEVQAILRKLLCESAMQRILLGIEFLVALPVETYVVHEDSLRLAKRLYPVAERIEDVFAGNGCAVVKVIRNATKIYLEHTHLRTLRKQIDVEESQSQGQFAEPLLLK